MSNNNHNEVFEIITLKRKKNNTKKQQININKNIDEIKDENKHEIKDEIKDEKNKITQPIKKNKKTKKQKINEKLILQEATEAVEDIVSQEIVKDTSNLNILSEEKLDPCLQKKALEQDIKRLNEEKLLLSKECNQKKYENIKLLNDKKLMDLIIYIFDNKIEHFQNLFDLFPESNERTTGFLSKPYIFEALWKIIFLLNLDNLTNGFKRQYKTSIYKDHDIEEYNYLNGETKISNINSGSESGIADFLFTVIDANDKKKSNKQVTIQNACEDPILKPNINDVYVFTSKFYKKEKSITNYDIDGIVIEIQEKYEKNKYKIVCLVKNGAEFKNRLLRSSKEAIKSYVDSNLIYDEGDLNLTYYPKLYKFLTYWFDEKNKDINNEIYWREILKNPKEIINILDNLRFHQRYVVEYTDDIINRDYEGRFIWGAVARSGKSYMVGGLVAKRKPKIVILILGAINETKSQFVDDLFKKYTDLQEYEVIDFQSKKNANTDKDKKYVYVISQESLRSKIFTDFCKENPQDNDCKKKQKTVKKVNNDNDEQKEYDDSIIKNIKDVLKEPDKIIFFDEIHQGSGPDSMQENTIRFFYNNSPNKFILIMVTATYAKPLAKYGKDIDNKDCILVEWNYEMIMKMKNFEIENVTIDDLNEDKSNYLIDINDADFESKMKKLKSITDELNEKGKTCQDIRYEYENNPELLYLLPTLKAEYKRKKEDLMDEDYNITEDNGDKKINIKTNLKEIFTLNPKPDRTFKYTNSVNKLLSYIYNNVYNELLEKQYNFVANGESNFHSQLWFMPTSMKNASKNKKNDEVKEKEDSAIVGPMLKNLGLAIINHRNFINFNVCVVHSGKEREKNEIISTFDQENHRKIYFQCIQSSNVKNCIKDIENKSKEANKSLIILTGQRLRLGITLPCVDIAIHMDNIKSYDIIYQSMFRVLTERPGKTRGYFVDMILDRAIQFFYKYTRNNKKITSIEKITKEDVRKNLLLFDVGSISQSFGFTTIDQPVNSYSEIAENFRIDKDEKFEQYKAEILKNKSDEDNDEYNEEEDVKLEDRVDEEPDIIKETEKNKKNVIKLLNNLYEDETIKEELNQIIQSLHITKSQNSKKNKKNKKQLEPFKGEVELPEQFETKNDSEDESKDESKDNDSVDENIKQLFKDIVEQLKNTFTLLILFDDKDSPLENILALENLDIDKITDCEDPDIMYYCYLISTITNDNKIGDTVKNKITNQRGEIINIIKNNKKNIYEINFDGIIVPYSSDEFKKDIFNSSIPNNFNLKEMDEKFIREYIQKNVELILFLLDKCQYNEINNLFDNIKKEMKKQKISDKFNNEKQLFKDNASIGCPETFIDNEKVLDTIRKYLTPKDSEKKLFGEVFTPLNLICEMLSKLPSNVWTNPDLTWLDPANGIGNFPVVVYYKLMEGLKNNIKDDEKRSKHIIENMIYMNELNPVNVALSKKVFKMIDTNATPNIVKADFIVDYDKILKIMQDDSSETDRKFDIIFGNPPYNKGGVGKGGGVLWTDFVHKSWDILSDNGYLLFIHPPGWRKPAGDRASAGDIWELFKNHNLLFLKISDKKIPNFPTVDYYIVEKNGSQKETKLINEFEDNIYNDKIDLYEMDFIPHLVNQDVINILKKVFGKSGEKFDIIRNQSFQATKKDMENRNGIPHAFYYDVDTNDYIIVYKKYTDDMPDYIDKPKIVMTYSNGKKKGFLYPKFYSEQMGTTSNTMYQIIETGDGQKNLITLLKSNLINFILKITQYSEPPNYKNEFKILNLISKPRDVDFNDDKDIYDYYGLNKREIDLIEKVTSIKEKSMKKKQDILESMTKKQKVISKSETKENTIKKNKKTSDKKTKKKDKKKGGKKKTRKHKFSFKLW